MDINDCIVYDIETVTATDKPDGTQDSFLVFGFYSYKTNEYGWTKNIETVKQLLSSHRYHVGFNNKNYDDTVLERYFGVEPYNFKIRLDLFECIAPTNHYAIRGKNRGAYIKTEKGVLTGTVSSYSLKNIAKYFDLPAQKGEFDFDRFKTQEWNEYEAELLNYLKFDIEVTKQLFEKYYETFEPFRGFMNEKSQKNWHWMTASLASYAYKVICQQTGLEEKYGSSKDREKYEGGFVALPTQSEARGEIYCLDFNSAYPHAFMMMNLYNIIDDTPDKHFELYNLAATYDGSEMGVIGKFIQKLYKLRLQYKEDKNPMENPIKIIINTIYGLSGNPVFRSVYDIRTCSDCTMMARTWIKYARETFIEQGYNVLYTDTDSVYLEDVFCDRDKMLTIRDAVVSKIKENVLFPLDTFDMGIDAEIKAMWFFQNDLGIYKKKNYIYITQENELKIIGLKIIKSDCSKLSKEVLSIIKPFILENTDIKFDKEYIMDMIDSLIKDDLTLVAKYYKVQKPGSYKSTTSIQAQIAKAYGPGEHWLVPNKKLGGAGKKLKYCTLEEAAELQLCDLDIDKIVDSELYPFIRDYQENKLLEKAQVKYEKKNDQKLNAFFGSDLWDSDAVGDDISDEEFLENEQSMELDEV